MKNWIIIVNIMIRVMTEKGLSGNDLTFNLTQKGQSPLCAHIRYRLIDELTGYRNNWQRLPH